MLKGIDVSTYQGSINWSAVKASGIDFAIVKATQGRAVNSNSYLFTDRQFAANVTGAHDAYNTGDIVGRDGVLYESLINGNTTVPGSDERYWKVYSA